MRAILRRIKLGACWSPEHGDHPGTPILLFLIGLGALAGHKGGWLGALFGASIMAIIFGSMWLVGCYDSGASIERMRAKEKVNADR